jgi:hypothetical protein
VLEENLHPAVAAILPWAIAIAAGWLSVSGSRREVYERRVTAAGEEPDSNKLFSGRIILYLRSFVDDENAAKLPLVMGTAGPEVGVQRIYTLVPDRRRTIESSYG